MHTAASMVLFMADSKSKQTLGDFLVERRAKKKQTQQAAATAVGVSRITWILWERGTQPKMENLLSIAEWAGVNLTKLQPYLKETLA